MKLGIAISLLSSFVCLSVLAQGAQPGTAGVINQQPNDALQAVVNEMPKVQEALKKCYDDPNTSNISSCLWSNLDDGTKNEVKEKIRLAQEAEQAAQPDSQNSVNLRSTVSGARIGTVAEAEDDPETKALKKLGDFYGKRLDEAFKSSDGKISITDQQVFYELAKSQLGKNVISAWSAVCIDAGWTETGKLVVLKSGSSGYQALRQKNIDSLQSTRATNEQAAGEVLSNSFLTCAKHLPMLCRQAKGISRNSGGTTSSDTENASNLQANTQDSGNLNGIDYSNYSVPKDRAIQSMNKQSTAFTTADDDDEVEAIKKSSQQRACETVAYVDGLRRQLAATEKLSAIMQDDESIKGKQDAIAQVEEKQVAEVDIDRLTTITSGDVIAEDSYYGAISENSQLIETCKQNPSDGQCINLIANTEEEKKRTRASGVAFMLETEILKEQLDPTQLAQLSEEEKKSLLRRLDPSIAVDEVNVEDTLRNISGAYMNERNALVESLAQKVKQLESRDDPASLQSNITQAGDRILGRGNEYVQLMHFNNIVSGYMKTDSGSNVRILDLELENIANLNANNQIGSTSGMGSFSDTNYASTLRQNIQEQNEGLELGGSNEQNEIINFKSDTIGQFLDYEITQ